MTQEAEAAVEAVARALCEPLGYTKQAADNWEGVWVGNIADSPETGSLAYLCRSLARAAIAAYEATLRPAIEAEIVDLLREREASCRTVASLPDNDDEIQIAWVTRMETYAFVAESIERGDHRAILRPVTPE